MFFIILKLIGYDFKEDTQYSGYLFGTYSTKDEALNYCNSEEPCNGIFDGHCDGEDYKSFDGSIKGSGMGSCTWVMSMF